jgi:hypothetical protein
MLTSERRNWQYQRTALVMITSGQR